MHTSRNNSFEKKTTHKTKRWTDEEYEAISKDRRKKHEKSASKRARIEHAIECSSTDRSHKRHFPE